MILKNQKIDLYIFDFFYLTWHVKYYILKYIFSLFQKNGQLFFILLVDGIEMCLLDNIIVKKNELKN